MNTNKIMNIGAGLVEVSKEEGKKTITLTKETSRKLAKTKAATWLRSHLKSVAEDIGDTLKKLEEKGRESRQHTDKLS